MDEKGWALMRKITPGGPAGALRKVGAKALVKATPTARKVIGSARTYLDDKFDIQDAAIMKEWARKKLKGK